jgi:hypothetical protein
VRTPLGMRQNLVSITTHPKAIINDFKPSFHSLAMLVVKSQFHG